MIPTKINIGSGKNYIPGWLNLDVNLIWKPDLIADISDLDIPSDHFEEALARDVLEHIPDLVPAMTNILNLLKVGGKLTAIVPYDLSLGAWQDPTHVRAFNENSWIYYTDWFWYLGWTTHRFYLLSLCYHYSYLGHELLSSGKYEEEVRRVPRAVDSMEVVLVKKMCSKDEIEAAMKWRSRV